MSHSQRRRDGDRCKKQESSSQSQFRAGSLSLVNL
ncbi:hypothetical protein T09_14510 [Trichinella sp. T9]|nr:hypothetical protein T09_14510 [Trichinella sp. T9]